MKNAIVVAPSEFWDEFTEALIKRGYAPAFVHLAISYLWGLPE